MAEIAIRAEHLSKTFPLGERNEFKTLRDAVIGVASFSFLRRRVEPEMVTALVDASFEINAGEVVGVIGRNGAGKSTLLKILSRITDPTTGRAEIHGRVGSLLEVGTGFHPELSGRENIFLNGAILGMKRAEISRKFDEIVAFAEVERFIDTPVKHYSSGMYLRLAFAVAAHMDPEILLVDEVLAVGDASFQRKCLNKMQDVGEEGRTVIFVSHNMPAVTRLCPRAIMLDGGLVVADGASHEVVTSYLKSGVGLKASREWDNGAKTPGNEVAKLLAVRVRTEEGTVAEAMDIRKPIGIEMEYEVLQGGVVLVPNYHFFNEEGAYLFVSIDVDPKWHRRPKPPGRYISTAWVPGNLLAEGTIVVGAALTTLEPARLHFFEQDAVAFHVLDAPGSGSARGDWAGHMSGQIRPLLTWNTIEIER